MNEKHREVRDWLKLFYEDEKIPIYEITEDSVDILNEFRLWEREKNRDSELILESRRNEREEYEAETKRINQLLKGILKEEDEEHHRIEDGSNSHHNSSSIHLNPKSSLLTILVESARLLEIDNPTEESLIMDLNDLLARSSTLPLRERRRRFVKDEIQKAKIENLTLNDAAKSALVKAEKEAESSREAIRSRSSKSEFFAGKQKEYAKMAEKYKHHLKKYLKPEYKHESLTDIKGKIDSLSLELEPLKDKLDAYQELPPSLELARVKLSEAKNELDQLTQTLTKDISELHI